MVEEFSFKIEEKECNISTEVECSEFFNEMLKNGDIEYLLDIFKRTMFMVYQENQ